MAAFIGSYVILKPSERLVVALWVIHTHCIELVEQTPYLAITSPEKQCGKTRLLEALELLVLRPWRTILPSEAVMFRHVHATSPTLLLDEIDTIFNPRVADRYEGHRALLNGGHRRGDKVPRCVGTKAEIVQFEPFCAKALAGIGSLPDTVADRSIPVRLARRKSNEEVKRFRRKDVEPIAEQIRQRIEDWAISQPAREALASNPDMPEELSDRMQEGAESLVAIADAFDCGKQARAALIELSTGERLDNRSTLQIRLLEDLKRTVEGLDQREGKRVRGIPTNLLIQELVGFEESPWGSYLGRGLEARDVSGLLKPYGISPGSIRFRGQVQKGYKRDDLSEAWERYL